jgi:hypothetical protein
METPASQSKTRRKANATNLYVHRNGGYYLRVMVRGKQIWESLRTKLKSVAEARATERHRAVRTAEKPSGCRKCMSQISLTRKLFSERILP